MKILGGKIYLLSKIHNILQISGEIPSATPDARSVRSTSGPIGPEKRVNHSLPYIDPCQPGNLVFCICY